MRNFELHHLGRLTGKVVDRDTGEPRSERVLPGQRESVLGISQLAVKATSYVSGQNGEFEISSLDPGEYVLADRRSR